jgi:hypothetical protein
VVESPYSSDSNPENDKDMPLWLGILLVCLLAGMTMYIIFTGVPQPQPVEYGTPCDRYTGVEYERCWGSYTH